MNTHTLDRETLAQLRTARSESRLVDAKNNRRTRLSKRQATRLNVTDISNGLDYAEQMAVEFAGLEVLA